MHRLSLLPRTLFSNVKRKTVARRDSGEPWIRKVEDALRRIRQPSGYKGKVQDQA